jgi:hypothetical protein
MMQNVRLELSGLLDRRASLTVAFAGAGHAGLLSVAVMDVAAIDRDCEVVQRLLSPYSATPPRCHSPRYECRGARAHRHLPCGSGA